MRKHLLFTAVATMAMSLTGTLSSMAQGYQTTIPFVETFDDETHYTLGGDLPDGWLGCSGNEDEKGFVKTQYYDNGLKAYSGDYYVSSEANTFNHRNDYLYTPLMSMKGGKEYIVSFYMYATGYNPGRQPSFQITAGTAQNADAQTIVIAEKEMIMHTEWTLVEAKFTPETDGEYSIALNATAPITGSGIVLVDDFSVKEGESVAPADPFITTIPFTETFDDATHYALGGDLPDGWAAYSGNGDAGFKTETYEDAYMPAYSGENFVSSFGMLSGRHDALFTPMLEMEAGKKYTVSFYIYVTDFNYAPSYSVTAGTAQNVEAQTIALTETAEVPQGQYTKVETTFTPETSGEYCIALNVTANLSQTGFVNVDDFSIEAEETEEPPVEEWAASIPYSENFDDASHYNGLGHLPNGWFSSGENPFVTAYSSSLPAVSGEYYMVAPSSPISNRRDIAYTPLLEMEAGQKYTVSFYLCMPGSSSTPSFKFTVGQDQAYDMQETVLLDHTGTIDEWTRYEYSFTPETTGEYCFAFWAQSTESGDGIICVDNFRLSKADEVFAPETDFKFSNTLHSQFTGGPKLFSGQTVQMINTTDDADSFLWTVTGGDAVISDATAVNPTITFKESANYTVTLEATNEGGKKEISKRFYPEFAVAGETDCVQTTSEDTDKIYQQRNTPAFLADGTVEDDYTYETNTDFVVGVNPYYRAFAERFDVPQNCNMELTSINYFSHNYYLFDQKLGVGKDEEGNDIYSTFDKDKKLTVVIYPEKDGKPDVANPIYSKTGLISEMIIDNYYSVRESVKFDDASEPVVVNGPFYIALEFDPLTLEPYSPDILSRSYVGLDTRVHDNGQTTLWVKPEKAIPGSEFEKSGKLNEYCRADEFSKELTGYSFGVMPWVVYGKMDIETGINGTENGGQAIKVYATVDGENFKVSGLKPGTGVRVYSSNGSAVFDRKAGSSEMIIPAGNWTSGVYVISADGQSIKVTK